MTEPPQPQVLAEHGGLVIAERGPEVLVIDRGSGATEIATFVVAILTLVCVGFGMVALFTPELPIGVGIGFLGVGLAFGTEVVFLVRSIRRRRGAPLNTFTPVAVFDRALGTYRGGAGGPIVPLDQVRVERRMRATSSSAMLVAVTPSGTRILKRGNPFGGGIGNLDQVLTAAMTRR
ncbi:hypothetical protein [Mycolicibacterium canariasense]|nr:hypothetical protein [Mycolicibacterium canariasense]